MRRRRLPVVAATLLAVMAGCGLNRGDSETEPWPAATTGSSTVVLTADQRRVAEQLVNVFEYSSTTARYDVVNDLGDGRGFTCGKIGFTTSSTEVRDVVQAYVEQVPQAPLGRHLPRLREHAESGGGDTTGLAGFPEDWADAANDPAFRAVQDSIANRLAFDPALTTARRLGIRTALGVAILFDTAVQHGTGDDPDGLPALVTRTKEATGGEPATGVPEKRWLLAFLQVRADDLRHPHNSESQQVWAESVDRVDALRELVRSDRHSLIPPVTLTVSGGQYELR